MNEETGTGIASKPNFAYSLKCTKWEQFYERLMQQEPKALDKVINMLEDIANSSKQDYQLIEEWIKEDEKKEISRINLGKKLMNYFARKLAELGIEDSDENFRFQWNSINNILRYFKRVKNDEAIFLLPYEDKQLAMDFLSTLNHPPEEY